MRQLRIAMLAPPWLPVPPDGYGGIETVVATLVEALAVRGHDITLLCAPGSRPHPHPRVRVVALLDATHRDEIGLARVEADHVACAFAHIDCEARHGRPYDVVHDHSGLTALAMADRVRTPVVHTIHGDLGPETASGYRHHGHHAVLVALSRSQRAHAPPGVRIAACVPNPVDLRDWPLEEHKAGYLLWLGRMDPVKGAHRAIAVARRAGRPLLLAGPIQAGQEAYFEELIRPELDERGVRYLGEIRGPVRQRVVAKATALLMPIRWSEPFGMVMVEALACGTPVLAFPEGAAPEIVLDGVNGFLVADERAMADAVSALGRISPLACRRSVQTRYSPERVAAAYEHVYLEAMAANPTGDRRRRDVARGDGELDGPDPRMSAAG